LYNFTRGRSVAKEEILKIKELAKYLKIDEYMVYRLDRKNTGRS